MDNIDTRFFARSLTDFSFRAGKTNVIMQLSYAPVGYGVARSTVVNGRADLHPVKRGRTTGTYLAVAALGTEKDRRLYRQAVNKQHAQVRSLSDSPVEYHAMDSGLQQWVASCLYYGAEDMFTRLYGPLEGEELEKFYRQGMIYGTTLQMPAEAWPATRADFDVYWKSMIPKMSISDEIRDYLLGVHSTHRRSLLHLLRPRRQRLNQTIGLLPPEFREILRVPWTANDQRYFDKKIKAAAERFRRLPAWRTQLIARALLWDFRMRVKLGWDLV